MDHITRDRVGHRRFLVGMHPRGAGTGNHTRRVGMRYRRDLPLDSLEGSLPRSFRVRTRINITILASIILMMSRSRFRRSLGVGRRIRVGGRGCVEWLKDDGSRTNLKLNLNLIVNVFLLSCVIVLNK